VVATESDAEIRTSSSGNKRVLDIMVIRIKNEYEINQSAGSRGMMLCPFGENDDARFGEQHVKEVGRYHLEGWISYLYSDEVNASW
jgi:hypothetical protein